MEAEGIEVSSSLRRYNEQYPGMNMSSNQMLVLNEKTKTLIKQVEVLGYKEVKAKMKQVWKEVLSPEQFAIYEIAQAEQRRNAQPQVGESIQSFLPLMEELLNLYNKEFLSNLMSIRSKLEAYISNVDRWRLQQIKKEYQAAFLEKVEWNYLPSEIKFNNQETGARFKQFYDAFVGFGLSFTIDVRNLDQFIGKESFELANKLGQHYSLYVNIYKREIEQLIANLEQKEKQIIEKYAKEGEGMMWDNGFSSTLDISHIIRILLLESNPVQAIEHVNAHRLHQAKAFPSPAVSTQTLDFEIQQTGEVLIEVIDAQGRVIKTLYKGERNQGRNSLNVNVNQFKGQRFFYRITDQNGTSTLKILLAK